MQSIALFLQKPMRVHSGDWTTASSSNTILHSFSILNTLLSNSIWMNKIRGYKYMRATAVIRLELNAQPFQQGRLLMHFLPQYAWRTLTKGYASHNACLTSKTQQNGIEIDTSNSEAILEVPYISPFSHVPLSSVVSNKDSMDWGSVFVSVLSSLKSPSGTPANYTLFLSFKDIEFVVPTAEMSSSGPRVARNQATRVVRKEKHEVKEKGVISAAIDSFSDAADYLKFIPGASGIVDTAQKVSSGMSTALAAFGWSKPLDSVPPQSVSRDPTKFLCNFNGMSNSNVLALDSMNELQPIIGGAGVAEDEMSFNYLKKIPAFIEAFTWDNTQVPGTRIYTKTISPVHLRFDQSTVVRGQSYTVSYAPPAFFLSRYFSQYRGSIKLTFKFVKTMFHTGRLMIVYDPSFAAANIDNTQNALREIVDLKDSYEFSVTLPYLSNTSYGDTGYGVDYTGPLGLLSIYVLNDLAAASTVSNDIQVLVYASGGDDFELSKPIPSRSSVVVPEMNDSIVLDDKHIGGYPEAPLTLAPMQSCIGEAFCSLKQLIISARFVNRTFDQITNSPSTGRYSFDIWPWTFGLPVAESFPTGPNTYELPPISGDYLSEFASGFAYYRGGLHYYLPPRGESGTMYACLHNIPPSDTVVGGGLGTDLAYYSLTPLAVGTLSTLVKQTKIPLSVNHTQDKFLDVKVPYYGNTPFRFTDISTGLVPNIPPACPAVPSQRLAVFSAKSDLTQGGVLRSASDDFTFHYFVGFLGFAS